MRRLALVACGLFLAGCGGPASVSVADTRACTSMGHYNWYGRGRGFYEDAQYARFALFADDPKLVRLGEDAQKATSSGLKMELGQAAYARCEELFPQGIPTTEP